MFWDKVSGVYDLFENIYNKSVYQATGESVAKYIKNTDRVLECACGTGAISIFIAPVCKNLFVSDYSVGMLKQARKKLKNYDNIDYRRVDITDIKAKDNSFNELNVEEIEEIMINGYDEIEVDGATYKILTDDEAEEEFESYQKDLFDDMGLSGFSTGFQTWIKENALDKDYFDDVVRESMEMYIEDIKYEGEDRLLEEMEDADQYRL